MGFITIFQHHLVEYVCVFFQPPHKSNKLTPQKFNMEPEKKSLEKEIPFGNHHFSGSMLNFGGVKFLESFLPLSLPVGEKKPDEFWSN